MGFFCIYRNQSPYIEIVQLPRLDLERSLLPGFSLFFEAEAEDSLEIIACQPPVTAMKIKKIGCKQLAV